jgi:uncharacterized delta-60 repeat protein
LKQTIKKAIHTLSMTALLVVMILANSISASAQFTFVGDYDRTFNAPLGYYIDPQNPVAPATDTNDTHFYTGELLPDGSIIAGGRHSNTALRGDFYIRKFTPSGAVDTSFGTNGFVRTNFHLRNDGVDGNDSPQILKVQPDGKIVFAGQCVVFGPDFFNFGQDACVIRYNANGTLDSSFGGFPVLSSNGNQTASIPIDPGKVIFQTGIRADGSLNGTDGPYYDMAIQPDGKIVLVGETRDYIPPFGQNGEPSQRLGAIIVRLNPNGSRDTTFGSNGIARWFTPDALPGCSTYPGYYQPRRFNGVRVQPDGRIIAVGYNSTHDCGGSNATGNRFVVTRWTTNGQLETVRYLDNNTAYDFQDEVAATVHLTRDASKILVSGSYRNLSGTPAGRQKPTLVRLNIGDLSLDTSFGNGGIAQYNNTSNNSGGTTLYVKAIQPDGKIIGTDNAFLPGNTVRLNPDGSGDQSFGNESIDGSATLPRGRLKVTITHQNFIIPIDTGHILVRPNGRINLIGRVGDLTFGLGRAVVSQQNTTLQNGIYADFENDGKDNLAVYRPSDGIWHNLDSRNNNYSASQWGISSDRLAPADYDGDGKTDRAIFRDGTWYISKSSNAQTLVVSFGLAGDLPRPGDFDGDGLADVSVFRPSSGTWFRLNSSNGAFNAIQFGASGDVPMLGDYDADGKTDFAVFRPSNAVWYVFRSSDNQVQTDAFGTNGDIPLNGDFNGDSRADLAVFRPSNRTWYVARPTGVPGQNFDATEFGLSTDVPVAADYDNDGKTDLAVYRNGSWWIQRSGTNDVINAQFGLSADKPIPAAYLP